MSAGKKKVLFTISFIFVHERPKNVKVVKRLSYEG